MRRPQSAALRPQGLQPSMLALAMALSVGVVAAVPSDAWAAAKDKGATSAKAGKGSANNGVGNGAGSSTNTSSGNNGNDKGVGNAGNTNGPSGGVTIVALPGCAVGDLTGGAAACSGYYQGNLLSGSPSDLAAQTAGLQVVGLSDWNGALVESQLDLSSSLVDFSTALNGFTFIGVHFGAGANSPSPHTPGGVTAFYRFDAGVNLDTILLTPGSASAARLYATGPAPVFTPAAPLPAESLPAVLPPAGIETGGIGGIGEEIRTAVPEPATWALMIIGFGAAGAALRRRRMLSAA